MADTDGYTYKHADLEGSLKTNLVIQELNSDNAILRRWPVASFATVPQALAARQIIADSLGKRELGPPLTEEQVEAYKASL